MKRDKTPRDITSQVLDYASAVRSLSAEQIIELADRYLGDSAPLANAFRDRFGIDLPEALNEHQRMLIVGSYLDSATERIVNYLSDVHNVAINVATFNYYHQDGDEYLARMFLLDPVQVESKAHSDTPTKRGQRLESLLETANRNGVGALYRQLASGLGPHFQYADHQRYAMRFWGRVQDEGRVLFRLVPWESDTRSGVKFEIYMAKFAEYFGLRNEEVLALLPPNRQEWNRRAGDPQWAGYEGFFQDSEQITKFVSGLQASAAGSPS